MQIEINEYFGSETEFGAIRDNLCTDWEIYKSIMYHLLQNAIKFSHVGHKIRIHIELCKISIGEDSSHDPIKL